MNLIERVKHLNELSQHVTPAAFVTLTAWPQGWRATASRICELDYKQHWDTPEEALDALESQILMALNQDQLMAQTLGIAS